MTSRQPQPGLDLGPVVAGMQHPSPEGPDPLSFLAVGMGAGMVFLLPAMALEIAAGQTMVLDYTNAVLLLYLCIFPSILGYLCLNRGIELIGANRAAPFIHLVPVFGSVLAIALLGERLQLFHAVGYALVLAGITLATRR